MSRMQGISILIVDDDKLLVEKLEKTMKWERLGIATVLTAYNIRQARALMEEFPVQILLCDIDMPQGSGLELLEWVRDRELDVECVFLSSYANFAYAQMAIQLSSRAYLLKPISNADLERSLEQVVRLVEKKRSVTQKAENGPRRELWEDLLSRRAPEERCIRDAIKNRVCAADERFCLVLVRIVEASASGAEKKDAALFDFVIRNVASEFFEECPAGSGQLEAVVRVSDLEWMLVMQAGAEDSERTTLGTAQRTISESAAPGTTQGAMAESTVPEASAELRREAEALAERVRRLTEHLRRALDRRTGIYLGTPVAFSEIGRSRERLEYMEAHAVFDEDIILQENHWKSPKRRRPVAPWEIWKRELLATDDVEQARSQILAYVGEQRASGGWEREALEEFLQELVQLLYQYLGDRKYDFAQLFDRHEFQGYEQGARVSMKGVKEFTDYLFDKLGCGRHVPESRADVVEQLKDYIAKHLDENITRADLARTVYLSEGYVSRIFLKETGISLPNYIAERRIEKAKEYLEHSALPVSRIATEVGYNNFSYFSRTFRELTGCTPNEYRTRINKKEHRH